MGKNLEQRLNTKAGREPTLAEQIQRMEKQFALAMPTGGEASQLVRDALTCLRQTPLLQQCTQSSVLGGLMTCAQLGLRPGVLGHAWLIPFYNRRSDQREAQLVIGYQGLVELAYRTGRIASIIARTVYEGDVFDVDYGLDDKLVHKPNLFEANGEPIAYYAIVKFTNGGHAFYVMSHRGMEAYRRDYAKSPDYGPWKDHFEAMAHKTCIRQLAKYMPKSTELGRALVVDEGVRVDVTPAAVDYPKHVDAEDTEPIDGDVIDGGEGEVHDSETA